jgi:transcriptional regulator with XRE-family HTH domain
MFRSNVREIMDKKKKTVRGIAEEAGLAIGSVHRATQDSTIGGCQLNTLAKIGGALGVKAKKLFDEVEGQELSPKNEQKP